MPDSAAVAAARRSATEIWQLRSSPLVRASTRSRSLSSFHPRSFAATTSTASTSSDSSHLSPASSGHSAPCHRHQPTRLSRQFIPTLRADSLSSTDADLASLHLLLRGGYIRQSSSGVFTLLPPGLRIVTKIQRIIQHEMAGIGASELAMPTLLSSALWHKTKRFQLMGSELYRLNDRKGSEFVLAPTHEEEVTRLVANEVDSEGSLPVRVFQITRKHRDEPRPRMGLLRTREFLMKDLYTFDADLASAQQTYDEVRSAYARIFDRIFGGAAATALPSLAATTAPLPSSPTSLPPPRFGWKSAEADTGAIGGSRSHEYHVEDAAGEDTLLSCRRCSYVANSEKAASLPSPSRMPSTADEVAVQVYGTQSVEAHSQTLYVFLRPADRTLNEVKLAKHLGRLEAAATSSGSDKLALLFDSHAAAPAATAWDWAERPEGPLARFERHSVLADFECAALEPDQTSDAILAALLRFASPSPSVPHGSAPVATPDRPALPHLFPRQFADEPGMPPVPPPTTLVDLRTAEEGDTCPACRAAPLYSTRAIEVGHTFLLGTRYSRALQVGFTPTSRRARSGGGGGGGDPAEGGMETHDDWLPGGRQRPFQMGCYGIGVSRIVGALAQRAKLHFDHTQLATTPSTSVPTEEAGAVPASGKGGKRPRSGLIWPRAVTPYEGAILLSDPADAKLAAAMRVYAAVVRIATQRGCGVTDAVRHFLPESNLEGDAELPRGEEEEEREDGPSSGFGGDPASDLVLDDRAGSLGSKLADADLAGYRLLVIVGRRWEKTGMVECRIYREGEGRWETVEVALDRFR